MARSKNTKLSILISDSTDSVSQQSFKLSLFKDLSIVGLVDNSEKTVNAYQKLKPDILYLGYELKSLNGIQTSHWINSYNEDANIILTSETANSAILTKAIQAGVRGVCLKSTRPDRLKVGIDCVNRGEMWIDEYMLEPIVESNLKINSKKKEEMGPRFNLTEREMDVLELLAKGYSNKKIGESLFISVETVKSHVSRIKSRLNASDRTHAAVIAVRAKLV